MYENPILNRDFADPSIIRADDGWFYAYGTRSYEAGNLTNIQCARSKNLIQWEYLPDALPKKPTWASKTREFWAPFCLHLNQKYLLYFSTELDDGSGMGIGIAVSSTPAGPFVDVGTPLLHGESFTTIDPMVFFDPVSRKNYLYWGSGHAPINVAVMADDCLSLRGFPQAIFKPSTSYQYEALIEGAYVIFHDEWYYLFYSGDNVWEKGRYALMVARSKYPIGPFERLAEATGKADSVILKSNERWDSPGQNSIIIDDMDEIWTVYHAVDMSHRLNDGTSTLRRVMLIDKLIFENGWPKIKNYSPSLSAAAPIFVNTS